MATTPTVYVICGNNCKYEGMTKEQILNAIVQAVENGEVTDIDKGFISTVLTINNVSLRFFYGEQSAYDALPEAEKENLYAIITNDTFKSDVNEALKTLTKDLAELQKKVETIETTYEKKTTRKQYFKNTISRNTLYTDKIVFNINNMARSVSEVIGCAGTLMCHAENTGSVELKFNAFWGANNKIDLYLPFIYKTYLFAVAELHMTLAPTSNSNFNGLIIISDTPNITTHVMASSTGGHMSIPEMFTSATLTEITLYYK